MEARIIRETYGVTAIASVATGRISSSGYSHARCPGGTGLIAGSQWKTEVENRMTRRSATTNSGSDASASMVFETIVSNFFSRCRAA
jgi:hypothetical protein